MIPSLKKLLCMIVVFCLCSTPLIVQGRTEITPTNSEAKTYMDYRKITNHSSPQWLLQLGAVTDANGLRVYQGRYCIAVGKGYTSTVGTAIDVELSTGVILPCIVGDVKQNRHTLNGKQCANGNIVEFIVEADKMSPEARRGNISKIPGFEGYVKSLNIHDDSIVIPDQEVEEVTETNEIANYEESESVVDSFTFDVDLSENEEPTFIEDSEEGVEDKSLNDLFESDETENADEEDVEEEESEVIDSEN